MGILTGTLVEHGQTEWTAGAQLRLQEAGEGQGHFSSTRPGGQGLTSACLSLGFSVSETYTGLEDMWLCAMNPCEAKG